MGNGKDIIICSDAWLPSISAPKVGNPMGIDFPEVRVNALINPHMQSWDVDLLQALFNPEEVNLIRGIPLGNTLARDKVVWPHTKSGSYSVKFGYYLSKKKEKSNGDSCSIPEAVEDHLESFSPVRDILAH